MLQLLCSRPGARISSLSELKKVPIMADVDFDAVLHKKIKPTFTPPVWKLGLHRDCERSKLGPDANFNVFLKHLSLEPERSPELRPDP